MNKLKIHKSVDDYYNFFKQNSASEGRDAVYAAGTHVGAWRKDTQTVSRAYMVSFWLGIQWLAEQEAR